MRFTVANEYGNLHVICNAGKCGTRKASCLKLIMQSISAYLGPTCPTTAIPCDVQRIELNGERLFDFGHRSSSCEELDNLFTIFLTLLNTNKFTSTQITRNPYSKFWNLIN